ncbi:MAG: TIGR03088 family PEP-CTERM/XrtA system glycosyltransferase [Burkholderiales bacterium]|nr:MAG: TIGR03088 family PEP-CTERM/XrtA system glycosyltransferase [Burkholderiales bacterium]
MDRTRAHIVHVVHRLDTGGMENGLVNLVNRLPAQRFRHTIVSLTGVGALAERIANREVEVVTLDRRPGPLSRDLPRLWRLFRRLRPALVHTRNVGTLEAQIAAALARVPVRVHGEHGWEVHDILGSNPSLLRTRRWLRRLVHAQVALSTPTWEFLRNRVGVPEDRLVSICNGVDTERFRPREATHEAPRNFAALGAPGWCADSIVVGYVGRLADVKNPLLLVRAFEALAAQLRGRDPALAARLRLALIGHGPLAGILRDHLRYTPVRDSVWMAGDRHDIPALMRAFDIYALPSIAEGINNTLLEAMASGLPAVATGVGGNAELVVDNQCGTLVESEDLAGFTAALSAYVQDPELRARHGAHARQRAVGRFGLDTMIDAYEDLYTGLLVRRGAMPKGWGEAAGRPPGTRASAAVPDSPAS